MRPIQAIAILAILGSAQASWFSNDDAPEYKSWDATKLQTWLETNGIHVPHGTSKSQLQSLVYANWESHKPWSQSAYESAQKAWQSVEGSAYDTSGRLKDSAFDSWSDSKLRDFLLEQGVVEPQGTRESLVLAAKKQYNSYTKAASSLSSRASAAASTAVYGDEAYQASKSASSAATVASRSATSLASEASRTATSAYNYASDVADRKLQDSKDYIYSTWSDNQLRSYLEKKGVIKTKQQATRDELLAKMQGAYNSATDPIYNAWSDSYMKEWLVSHGIVKSDYEKDRDHYLSLLKSYYYGPQEKAWSSWSDSDLKQWLVDNNVIKSDAQIQREKLQKLVEDNWYSAKGNAWAAWSDSSMKNWLIEKGYMRSDAEYKRDQLVKLMNDKYNEASSKSGAYLTWPDARLRGYLRAHGVDDSYVPTSRPGLLQEVRIRWYESNNRIEMLIQSIRQAVYAGVENAEAKLSQILEILGRTQDDAYKKAGEAQDYAADKTGQAKGWGASKTKSARKEAAKTAEAAAAAAESSASKLRAEANKYKNEL